MLLTVPFEDGGVCISLWCTFIVRLSIWNLRRWNWWHFLFFSFIQSNLKGFQQDVSSPRCFVVFGGGGHSSSSSTLHFLSLGNGTPGDLTWMVLTKYMYFYVPCPLKERAWCLDCSNLLPFFQSQKCIVDTLKPICSRESFSLRQITYTGLHSYSVFMPEKGRNRSQKITQLNIYICRLPFLTAL